MEPLRRRKGTKGRQRVLMKSMGVNTKSVKDSSKSRGPGHYKGVKRNPITLGGVQNMVSNKV